MQLANAIVSIAGNINHTVLAIDLTPAEVIVLKAIHGDAAVNEIVMVGKNDVSCAEEKGRLQRKYDKNPNRAYVEKLFPGHSPALAKTFKEAGIQAQVAPKVKQEKGNIVALKEDGTVDKPTEKELRSMREAESAVTAT